jgi:hypothetical protein
MTVLLVRRMAKELAGVFYEQADAVNGGMWSDTKEEHERSKRFRDTYPTLSDYLKGYQRCSETFAPTLDAEGKPPFGYFRVEHSDRWWKLDRPGWQYFVEQARTTLATMLRNPAISDHEKTVISDALIKEFERSADKTKSEKVLQRRMAGKTQIN